MKRIHIHIGVEDLDKSIQFYSTLFGAEPTVLKNDYAKWMLDDPRVNLAISNGRAGRGIEHLGIQAESDDELEEIRERLAAAQTSTFDEQETSCCYAKSNKTWARDPQEVVWETFHTMAEVQHYGDAPSLQTITGQLDDPPSTPCCQPTD